MPNVTRRHGMGVRLDVPPQPKPTRPEGGRTPKAAPSAMEATYTAAMKRGLTEVSASKAKSLEAQFNAGKAPTENLSQGRVGASINGMVVGGELFIRSKAVRPGVSPTWSSAGPLKAAPNPDAGKTDEVKGGGWGPKPKGPSLEARVQKTLSERMGLLSNPDFQLKGKDLAELKKAIKDGEVQTVNATPKGLAGVGYTGHVAGDMLIIEKRAVRPGAASTFHMLGPID